MTTRSLFSQAFGETGHDTDATPAGWFIGTQLSSSDPIALVRGLLWAPSVTAHGAYDWRVYSGHIGETRTLIASGALGAYTAGGGWQQFDFDPVDVSGLNFIVGLRSTEGDPSYAYATGKWPASNGSLSGNGSQAGCFSTSGGAPDNGSTLFFMIDALVSDTADAAAQGAADLTASVALASSATAIRQGAASLPVVIDLMASGQRIARGSMPLATAVELAGAAVRVARGAVPFSTLVGMTASASGARLVPGTLSAGDAISPPTLTAGSSLASGLIAT